MQIARMSMGQTSPCGNFSEKACTKKTGRETTKSPKTEAWALLPYLPLKAPRLRPELLTVLDIFQLDKKRAEIVAGHLYEKGSRRWERCCVVSARF
jgi:hypothetical protein